MNCMDSTTKTPSTRCYECGIIAGVVLEGLLGKVHGASLSLSIYIYIHKHSKGTLFNSPNGFQFLPIFAEGSLLKAHESTRKEAGLGEKTPP